MPKYYGCPCEGCGKPLTLQDDIVVCPDCGAPYHRVCYEKLGQCIHRPAHAAGYEWKFPYEESQLRTCPSCGERTLRDEETCRCCGAVLPPEGQEPPSSRGSGEETFDYSQMYRQFGTSADPEKEFFEDAFGKEAKMDGIDRQDWLDYIGPAAPAYLAAYSRMQLQKSKISMSFSALLFGPFYFFYRKAWKPAFGFLAAELLLAAPTFIEMLQLSGSALAPAMSASALTVFARVCSVLSFVLMLVRGMYGKWLYRKSAADHIRRAAHHFEQRTGEDEQQHAQRRAGEHRQRHGGMHRAAHAVPVSGSGRAGDGHGRADAQTHQHADQKLNKRGRRADGGHRDGICKASDHDDIRGII